MLFLDVNLGGGKVRRLIIKDGDDAMQIATDFWKENSKLTLLNSFRFEYKKRAKTKKCNPKTTCECTY